MSDKPSSLKKFVVQFFTSVVILAVDAWVAGMWLYDGIVAPLFHTPTMTYWQAAGVFYLMYWLVQSAAYAGWKTVARCSQNELLKRYL